MRTLAILALLTLVGFAGCLSDDDGSDAIVHEDVVATNDIASLVPLVQELPISLNESHVDVAVGTQGSLYEPTMDVCDDGSIYITGHTILVDTTGAPVFGSHDGGETWAQLPWFQTQTMPGDVHGATPPPSDEIYLSCGEDGWLYGVDITLATFPVNAWSDYGTVHAYHNPNAFDEAQVALQASECAAAPIKDRPWGAYGNGKLLLVNNDGAGPAQVGVIDAPALAPVGVGATTGFGRWNLCAGPNYTPASNSIEGIPDMRDDGFFAVPQISNNHLFLMTGNSANVFQIDVQAIFPFASGGEITSVYGQAVFDGEGTLFAGVSTNSAPDAEDNDNRTGAMTIAVSTDNANSFQHVRFEGEAGYPLRHFYMDGNKEGRGALVVWAIDAHDENMTHVGYDWFMGHLMVGDDGEPVLSNVALVIDNGPMPSAHVNGASVGPDGRAYTAIYRGSEERPLSVYIQQDGPTLPVFASE